MTVRRSGRERRKPEDFYADAKKGRDDDMDEDAEDEVPEEAEENDNEDSGSESDEAFEAKVPKKSPVARRQSSGSTKKATPRTKASPAVKKPKQQKRQSKSSAAGDDDDEDGSEEEVVAKKPAKKVVKKSPVAAKGRKKAAAKRDEDSGDSEVSDLEDFMAGQRKKQVKRRGVKPGSAASLENLDERVSNRLYATARLGLPVELLVNKWVEDFEDNEGKRCAELFNFLAFSCGASTNIVDVEDGLDDYQEAIEALVADLQKHHITSYAIADGPRGKNKLFLAAFSEVWQHLVRSCREGNGHNLDVLRAVIDVLRNLCNASLVGIRHTATCAGLELGSFLVTELLGLAKKVETAGRQLEAEQKKGGGSSRKANDLTKNIEQVTRNIADLEAVLEEIFNGVFALRYRDVNGGVRADCMEHLGNFLMEYPNMFLKDQFIKYVGWMLHDKDARVRSASAQVLVDLYGRSDNLPKLENFTLRFLKRLQDLVNDPSEEVAGRGIAILRQLQAAGYLDDTEQDTMDQVDEKLLDPTYKKDLRTEAMLFFTDHVEGFNTETSGDGKKKKMSSAVKDVIVHRLVTVATFLDYHLEDTYTQNEQSIQTAVESFEEHPEGDFLYDWPTYFEILRDDKARRSELSDREHSTLIRLMVASVQRAAEHAQGSKKGGKKGAKKDKDLKLERALEAFTTGAIDELPKLLSQYQTNADKVVSLVKLPQYLQRDTIENKRNKEAFNTLLGLLRSIYTRAIDETVLTNAAKSLAHLLHNDTDRQHNVAVALQGLTQDLLKRLDKKGHVDDGEEKQDTHKKGKKGKRTSTPEDEDEASALRQDKDFAAGLVLMQLRCLATKIDLSAYVDITGMRTAVCAVLEPYLETTAWPEEQDRLRWTTRVLREGMQLSYMLFVHSTSALIKATAHKYPPKPAPADGEEEEEEEGKEVDEDDEELLAQAEAVVEQREELVQLLHNVLDLAGPPDATTPSDASDSGSQDRAHKAALDEAIRNAKKCAYTVASELRILCRKKFSDYLVLRFLVWSPESEFLRVLQAYFKEEEDRYFQADDEVKEEADAALVNDLLEPLIRSVIYTSESANRRQAAAIATHLVCSGRHSSESVKFFMKKLKEADFRLYLEVMMATLRGSYSKWVANPDGDARDDDKFRQLGSRLAQSLGKQSMHESFLRFLKAGIAYSFEDAPHNFPFLEGVQPFLSRVPDEGINELRGFYDDRNRTLSDEVTRQLEEALNEENPEDLPLELRAYRGFRTELLLAGHGDASPDKPKSRARKSVGGRGRGRSRGGARGRGRAAKAEATSPAPATRGRGTGGRGRGRGRGGKKMRSYEEIEDAISQSERSSRGEDSSEEEDDEDAGKRPAKKRMFNGASRQGRGGKTSRGSAASRRSTGSSRLDPLEELGEMSNREEDEDEAPRGKGKAVKKRARSPPSEDEDEDSQEESVLASGKQRARSSQGASNKRPASQSQLDDEQSDHDSLFGELTAKPSGNKKIRN